MNENEVAVIVRGADKVRNLCNALQEAQSIFARSNNLATKPNCTVLLANGLTLTCAFIRSYQIVPVSPVQIDASGRVVNAEITIKYVEPAL